MDTPESKVPSALRFIVKAVVFTLIFWGVWLLVIRPLSYAASDQSQAEKASDDAYRSRLFQQLKEAEELQAQYRTQLQSATASVKRQQELLDRWEKVIEQWERSAPKAK